MARALAGRDGEPARLAAGSLIALTCHRLGYEPSARCPTPLEWFPAHLEAHLSEELVGEGGLLTQLLRRPRHRRAREVVDWQACKIYGVRCEMYDVRCAM